ncbi:hypothetical protein AX774_g5411 [Zancudomyces culisetae]|uniref:ATP synthase subunit K, mitochondrial n=1 Tax=Zancudomyces culisetae TaxID=1213189 RepID=A0A1R1PJJ0_ZANCU|nr:hypothetical protein AX774_g5411 [Zancudomyces culisetae]|eukprot:OMH81141.1 hypothetical protein AX774_g5411 [Zancudomyces culisetae]
MAGGGFYTIAGRKVATHQLAIGGLVGYGLLIKALMPKQKDLKADPPIKASSDDEFKFIEKFIKEAEAEDAKAHH